MRFVRLMVVVSALTGGIGSEGCKRKEDVVRVHDDDAEMNAAIAESRRRWPEFAAAFAEKKGEAFSVKYPFPYGSEGGHEHIWLAVSAIDGDKVTGVLDNDPEAKIGHKRGDTVTVPVRETSDWLYMRPGTKDDMVGGFTIKVMLDREKKR